MLFNNKLDFDDIDINFFNKFLVYLAEEKGNSQNTVQKKIADIKSLFHKATKAGFNKKMDYLDFKVSKVKTEKVFLTKEELFNLYNLYLSTNKRLEIVRDIFCFGCYTGLRFSDIDALIANGTNMKLLSENAVNIFFTQVFRDSFFHADMHQGNLFVKADGTIVAIDFGTKSTVVVYQKDNASIFS